MIVLLFDATASAAILCLTCLTAAAAQQPQQLQPAEQMIGVSSTLSQKDRLHPLLPDKRSGVRPEAPPESPPIDNVRYTENYGYLSRRDAAASAATLLPWAPLKYIPLDEAGDIYLTLGLEFRLRYERFHASNWGDGPQDGDGYLWARALPLADLHLGRKVRLFGQLISASVYDLEVEKSPVDEDRLDLLQGFADVRLPPFTLRLGRQLMTYGSGRLIDLRYGPNVLQSFDAAKALVETDHWNLDIFYARPVDHRFGVFDDRTDDRQSLWSLYGTLPGAPLGLDLYYIGYLNENAFFANVMGRELRHTLGARLFGETDGWDWNFEFFYQLGDFSTQGADGKISAWSVASDTGYSFERTLLTPRLALRANIISGDRNSDDPDVQTFNPLFPKGKYFGELSPIGPSNLIHLNPYAALHLTERLQLTGNLAFYWRQSKEDGIYGLGGMDLLRDGSGSDSRYIGTQAELLLELQMNRHLSASGSYSIFTAGDFIEDTGADETMHFIGVEWMYRF